MIIFDFRLGRFSILATHGGDRHKYCGFTRERGELILDLPFGSLIFTNHRKVETM